MGDRWGGGTELFAEGAFVRGGIVPEVGPFLAFHAAQEAGWWAIAGEDFVFEIGVNALVFVHCS